MLLTLASKDPWDVSKSPEVFARFLDLSPDTKGRAAVSKVLSRLKNAGLITVTRKHRRAVIHLLRENGGQVPYTYPQPDLEADRYFKLPIQYWTEEWYHKLNLPGITMLLILLAEKDGVLLPIDKMSEWYGISRSTAERGRTELQQYDLLQIITTQRVEPLSPLGYTIDRHLHLKGPFERNPTPAPTTAARRRKRRQAADQRKEVT